MSNVPMCPTVQVTLGSVYLLLNPKNFKNDKLTNTNMY